jgi:sugar phosphate isomerase/epimerase
MLKTIGLQLYSIREHMTDEACVRESFRRIKAMGYDEAQTAGCQIPYADFGRIAREEGITIVGTHDNFDKMIEDPKLAIENHKLLGTTNMGIGGRFFNIQSKDEVYRFIENANKLADIIYEEGMRFTYHHHSHEFIKYDGVSIMDMLIDGLDPKKTSFVLDTYWLQHAGADVNAWIKKLAGRVDILHLKDMGMKWSETKAATPYITEIGNGNINFEAAIKTALESGVKHFCVEQDICPGDSYDSVKISADYLIKNFKK